MLIINDLFFGFRDGVLWFVKALFMLYTAFCAFTVVYQHNHAAAFTLLTMATVAITVICSWMIGRYSIISIPMFMVGVVASACKQTNVRMFNLSLVVLGLSFLFVTAVSCIMSGGVVRLNMVGHTAVNYIVVALFLTACTIWKFHINTPKFITEISFDVYLVHNKVLVLCKSLLPIIPLWIFVLGTIAATVAFGCIRKIIRI